MKLRKLAWIIPLGAAPLGMLWYFFVPPAPLQHLGGRWYVGSRSNYWAGHSSHSHQLYRKSVLRYVSVDDKVTRYRYSDPDCVIFQSRSTVRVSERLATLLSRDEIDGVVFAVCGDRAPAPIMLDSDWRYEFQDRGLYHRGRSQVVDNRLITDPESLKPIEDVRALALRQPSYGTGWRKRVRFDWDDAVRSIEPP